MKWFFLILIMIGANGFLIPTASAQAPKIYNCLVYAEIANSPRSQIGREKMTMDQCLALVDQLIRLRCLSAPGQNFVLSYVIDDPNSLDDRVGLPIRGQCSETPRP